MYRRIGVHRRIDYHESAYQIPTFNTTNWYTGELAYTGESITINRRIRFQRSTQQIDTPANQRTQANRLPSFGRIRFQCPTQQIGIPANRRTQANRLPSFGVSDSNVQHNRLVHRRSGVPATGDRRVAVSDSNVQHNRLVHRRIGVHGRIDYHHSAYQIPTSNTTD